MSLDDWKKGQTLPAYKALDNVTFAKIVNFYYQDYVCFGYEPKIPDFDDMERKRKEKEEVIKKSRKKNKKK